MNFKHFALLASTLVAPLLVSDSAAADAPTKAAPSAAVDDAVARVQAFYDKTRSFRSEFEQEYFVKSHNVTKRSKGQVLFAKPGKMRWDYSTPAGNKVVSDGKLLRVYEEANKQVFEQPAAQQGQYPAALAFLTGQGKIADVFQFELVAGEKMKFPGGFVLVGTPKRATPAYQRVFFYVDAQTSQIRRVLLLDAQGNRNRFQFIDPHVNVPVAPDAFDFTPPAGTTFVRQ